MCSSDVTVDIARQLPRALHLVGVDLILDSDRCWKVLEVNDHPIGLDVADRLSLELGSKSVFDPDGEYRLARALAEMAGKNAVCLLLPECFRIATGTHRAISVNLEPNLVSDDSRVYWTIDHFNSLSKKVRELGASCWLSDTLAMSEGQESIAFTDGIAIGSLYRRAPFPRLLPNSCAIVNDLRARSICGNKLQTDKALACAGVPRVPVLQGNLEQMLSDSRHSWLIQKPVWGSGSYRVERIARREAIGKLRNRKWPSSEEMLQFWVEPATVKSKSLEYFFDVRLYVLRGSVVAGFARRAAAPRSGTTLGSPLSWLTTTGPVLGLGTEPHDLGVSLAPELIEPLAKTACQAVMALDNVISHTDYSTCSSLPPFSKLAGTKGQIRTIQLKGN
jgi:hypothetical protein